MAREVTYNNFEISLVVFMPNITTNQKERKKESVIERNSVIDQDQELNGIGNRNKGAYHCRVDLPQASHLVIAPS